MSENKAKTGKSSSGLMAKAEAVLEEEQKEQGNLSETDSADELQTILDSDVVNSDDADFEGPDRKPHHKIHEPHGRRHEPKHHREHRKGPGIFSRILTKIIIILILLCSLMLGGLFYFQAFTKPVEPEAKSVLIQDQLQYCQEFVSIKYRYSDIISLKKNAKIGPAKSYSIVKYSAIIRVGIADMSLCDYEVSEDGKSVKITLPDAEILGNEIVSQEVFDEQHSIFVPITLEEVFTEIEKSKEDALDEIMQGDIITEAKEYAKRIVRQMLLAAGYEEVVVM